MDYSIFYKRCVDIDRIAVELEEYDVLISAFNSSERIRTVFDSVRAKNKVWHIHPEYQYLPVDEPGEYAKSRPADRDEVIQVNTLFETTGDLTGLKICIDITGFMRHVILFMIAKLKFLGVASVTVLYSEPKAYSKQEDTLFSTTTTGSARPVKGMKGSAHAKGIDYLILGVGYDHKLITEVTGNKDDLAVYPVFGFPSLSADMYQQSAIKAAESGEVAYSNSWIRNRRFAPANDPFATATVLSNIAKDVEGGSALSNIYLSPQSTKAQTLGFALFWLFEQTASRSITMLMPECVTYSRETSIGLRRLWAYEVELV